MTTMPVSLSPGAPRVEADTAALIDHALILLAKRRWEDLVDPDDVMTRTHLLASLRDQITSDLAQAVDDAITDDRPVTDIAIVADTDPVETFPHKENGTNSGRFTFYSG